MNIKGIKLVFSISVGVVTPISPTLTGDLTLICLHIFIINLVLPLYSFLQFFTNVWPNGKMKSIGSWPTFEADTAA